MVLDVVKADRGSCGHVLSSGELPQTDMSLCQELLHWSPASMECLIVREVCRFSAKAVLTSSSYHEMLSYTLPEIGQRLENHFITNISRKRYARMQMQLYNLRNDGRSKLLILTSRKK